MGAGSTGALRRFAVNISASGETTPNARNAYNVGRTPPRSLVEPLESRQTMAPAASPARVEIVRELEATSSRVPHFGHSMSFDRAAATGAGISVLQWGHMRTATAHLPVRTPYNSRSGAPMKREDEKRKRIAGVQVESLCNAASFRNRKRCCGSVRAKSSARWNEISASVEWPSRR